ncbi:hypothetical protein H2201_003226 [Coniosporium apollinis]|uniref:Small ribosomal subunit protein uS7 domain-containing protein n=1 Tax=Coniosporium apollinis TaxID=61459 RepID=A0ABQ9NWT1_9PEZI|nr:hypothetical protein H2201_003226 [Coniosporium apollinis]
MPPRIDFFAASRPLTYRPKALTCPGRAQQALKALPASCRGFANSKDLPVAEGAEGPNTDTLPHVSEEAAAINEITGKGGPEIEQGSPVQEVVKGDKEAEKNLPKVMQQDMKASKPSSTRSYHTSARRLQDATLITQTSQAPSQPGVKFGLPELPMPRSANLHHRYDPVVEQVTNLMMRHGKLSVAQRNMSLILTHLRTASPPTINPLRPLLPGAPPPSHLPLNPILYLTLAIDSVAPLMRIRSQRGAAGGGVALQIPVPLGLRQRRRTAVQWILDAATKRRNRGSGKGMFAQRVAEELVSVVEGKSSVWEKRGGVHKMGVSARANLKFGQRR